VKGVLQKAKSGLYPSNAPAGYRNAEGRTGGASLPNQDAPKITRLFDEFATSLSGTSVAEKFPARTQGADLRRAEALVIAVIPLDDLVGALQRTGKNLIEIQTRQPGFQSLGVAFSLRRQR